MRTAAGVQQIVGSRVRRGERTLGAMIDLQKCFDTIDPRVVEVFMRSKGVNGTLLKNTMQKYCQKRVRAKAKGKQSVLRSEWYEEKKVVGATQGGVDSMEFLTVITDHLEEALIAGGVKGVSVAKVWEENEGGWRDETRREIFPFADPDDVHVWLREAASPFGLPFVGFAIHGIFMIVSILL